MLRLRYSPLPLLLLAVLAFIMACGSADSEKEPPPGTTPLTIVNNGGKEQRLNIEIADTVQERTTGLSGRSELADDGGMLFIIPVKGIGFWMKDTLVPLSVAFIGECGDIVHIADMEPQTLDLHDTDRPYSFGLEVNQGWFAEHGIAVGSRVMLPAEVKTAACP